MNFFGPLIEASRLFFHGFGGKLKSFSKTYDRLGRFYQGNWAIPDETLCRHNRTLNLSNRLPPALQKDVFVTPNSSISGDVQIGWKSTVWYGAVIRGDQGPVRIGKQSSIGELSKISGNTEIGDEVFIGEGSILHSCKIRNLCKVELGAIIQEGVVLEKEAHIQGGSVVVSGTVVPSGQLWGGSPANFIRMITDEERIAHHTAVLKYHELALAHRKAHSKTALEDYLDQHIKFGAIIEGYSPYETRASSS